MIDYLIIGEKLEIVFQNENGDIGYDREITSNNIQRAFYIIHARGIFKKIENYMGLSYLAYRAMGRADGQSWTGLPYYVHLRWVHHGPRDDLITT